MVERKPPIPDRAKINLIDDVLELEAMQTHLQWRTENWMSVVHPLCCPNSLLQDSLQKNNWLGAGKTIWDLGTAVIVHLAASTSLFLLKEAFPGVLHKQEFSLWNLN